jgi:hypothetical protein
MEMGGSEDLIIKHTKRTKSEWKLGSGRCVKLADASTRCEYVDREYFTEREGSYYQPGRRPLVLTWGPDGMLAGIGEPSRSDKGGGPVILLSTSMGDMKIELFEKEAPETVKNFLAYVNDKFYDGTIFHRVIAGFMVQGGGMTPDMQKKKTKPPIKNESRTDLRMKPTA